MKSIKFYLILGLSLLILQGCAAPPSPAVEDPSSTNTSTASAIHDNSASNSQSSASTESELLPEEAFMKVLLNEIPFLYTDQNRSIVFSDTVLLSEVTNDAPNADAPSQAAVVDMDGDGSPEIVFQKSNYKGYIVFRYIKGTVYGYDVHFRGLLSLKNDGSYRASSSATDTSFGKMRFLKNYYDTDVFAFSVGQSPTNYYIGDDAVEKDAFDELWTAHENLPDVEWHEFASDTLKEWLPDDYAAKTLLPSDERQTSEMQLYLDSLADLLYCNYLSPEDPAQNDYDAIDQKYYDGWDQALAKIYELLLQKLSDEDRQALNDDQQRWLDLRENLAMTAPMSFVGDMTKMRTYHLISVCFGGSFLSFPTMKPWRQDLAVSAC